MQFSSEALESTAISASKVSAYGGAATAAVAGGMSVSEMAAITGAIVAILGLILNQYWSWKKDQREAALLLVQAEALRRSFEEKAK